MVYVLSKARWAFQCSAHDAAGACCYLSEQGIPWSLDIVRSSIMSRMINGWTCWFNTLNSYPGHNFLHLTRGRRITTPTHIKFGPWLSLVGKNNALTAWLVRSILNHAPIGKYQRRFNLSSAVYCMCWWVAPILETQRHIISICPWYRCSNKLQLMSLQGFIDFLTSNPTIFSFAEDVHPRPTQAWESC